MFAILNKTFMVCTRSFLSLLALVMLIPVAIVGFLMVVSEDGLDEAANAVYVLYADISLCLREWIFKD